MIFWQRGTSTQPSSSMNSDHNSKPVADFPTKFGRVDVRGLWATANIKDLWGREIITKYKRNWPLASSKAYQN
jgi:hypothetical protein